MACAFCDIVAGTAPASVVHDDDRILAFMDIRPVRPGQLLVIPKQHIDHFTDLPDDLAAHIFLTGQRLARKLRDVFRPQRVGMVVHGFGVPHAHLIVLPLEHPWDITSAQFSYIEDGKVRFAWERMEEVAREELDRVAAEVRGAGR